MTQKWKKDPSLHSCDTVDNGQQTHKVLPYGTTYVKEFLNCDPLKDWPSFDRCKWLWHWAIMQKIERPETVLDCGTKDGQFPHWLRDEGYMSVGVEISEPYVRYAVSKGRPVYMADVCCMPFADNQFDFVFSHHLHGLTPDYYKALDEMFRVSKKYMLALNQIPGNKRKHYSYISSPAIFHEFVEEHDCEVIFNNYLKTGFNNEWVIFLEKGPDATKI